MSSRNHHATQATAQHGAQSVNPPETALVSRESPAVENAAENENAPIMSVETAENAPDVPTENTPETSAPVMSQETSAPANAPEANTSTETALAPDVQPAADVQPATAPIVPVNPVMAIDVNKTAAAYMTSRFDRLSKIVEHAPDSIKLVGSDGQKVIQAVSVLRSGGDLAVAATTKVKTQATSVLSQVKAMSALFGKPENGCQWPDFKAFVREYAAWFDNYAVYLKHWESKSRIDGQIVGHVDAAGNTFTVMQSILVRWNTNGCDMWRKAEEAVMADDPKVLAYDNTVLVAALETALRGGDLQRANDDKTISVQSFPAVQWNRASMLRERVMDVANFLSPPKAAEKPAQTLTDAHGNPLPASNTSNTSPSPQTESATNTQTSTSVESGATNALGTSSGSTSSESSAQPSPVKSLGGKTVFREPETSVARWDAEIDPQAIRDANPEALSAVKSALIHAARTYAELQIMIYKVKVSIEGRFDALTAADCHDSVAECLATIAPIMGSSAFFLALKEKHAPEPQSAVKPPAA